MTGGPVNFCLHEGVPDHEWDLRQAENGAHMLQGRDWATFQAALGRQVVWDEADGWSWMGSVDRGRGYCYLAVPYGPTLKSADQLESAVVSLTAAAHEWGADFIRCEPVGAARGQIAEGPLLPAEMSQPDRTSIVDLSPEESELRRGMTSGHRNAINQAASRDIEVTITSDLTHAVEVIDLILRTASQRRYQAHGRHYYATMLEVLAPTGFAKLGIARADDEMVSAAIVFDSLETRAYAHAGNSGRARELKSSVPLVWRLMTDAKERGETRFDLWGVAPPDAPPGHPWAGLSQFKRAFGGQDVEYAGTWDLPVKRIKTALILSSRRVAKRARPLLSNRRS